MKAPDPHPDEELRLKALRDLGLMETPGEERFDRITALARRLLGVPISAVTLIGEKNQFFKSRQGIDLEEIGRETSFCAHTILQDDVMVVPDAREDIRFADNPFVSGEAGIRFYAGCSLRPLGGPPIGVLCVMDRLPRRLTEEEVQTLRDLSVWVEHEMNAARMEDLVLSLYSRQEESRLYQDRLHHVNRILKRLASADGLTGIPNRLYFEEHLAEEFMRRRRNPASFALIMVDVDHFKRFNDRFGHLAGDECLAQVAHSLESALKRQADFVARFGGEEFVIVLPDTDRAGAEAVVKEILDRYRSLAPTPGWPEGAYRPTLSMGVAVLEAGDSVPPVDLLERADKALYASKAAGRDRVTFWPVEDGGRESKTL